MTTTSVLEVANPTDDDSHYLRFLSRLQERFNDIVNSNTPLLTTNVSGLFETYLANIPSHCRQHYNCHCCRDFLQRYGGLVVVDDHGQVVPVFWDVQDATPELFSAIDQMRRLVMHAKVTGVFRTSETQLGHPVTHSWKHMAVIVGQEKPFFVKKSSLKSAHELMAEKVEEFHSICLALSEHTALTVDKAVALLQQDQLYRSEKCLGQAQFLQKLHLLRSSTGSHALQNNLIWREIAYAPAGFCHPRNSVIATLLDDIKSGMDFQSVERRFAAKMRPDLYQRPQATPSDGNINQAERIVEKLGIARSLERRYATLDDIQEFVWKPKDPETRTESTGVFGHLRTKKDPAPKMVVPASCITWAKFEKCVLPTAISIECIIPPTPESYRAFVTAVHDDAPPILQWDLDIPGQRRNPVSTYMYVFKSLPYNWNLATGPCKVTGISTEPHAWHGRRFSNQPDIVTFFLNTCRDLRFESSGLGLFPENLRSDLHPVRATIEHFSNQGVISGSEHATACGISISKSRSNSVTLRVTSKETFSHYIIDRWE